jgi:hypothetical protein
LDVAGLFAMRLVLPTCQTFPNFARLSSVRLTCKHFCLGNFRHFFKSPKRVSTDWNLLLQFTEFLFFSAIMLLVGLKNTLSCFTDQVIRATPRNGAHATAKPLKT